MTIEVAPVLDRLAIAELQHAVAGTVLTAGHAEYDSARRLVNAYFDAYPTLIVRCQTAYDVAAAVVFAREYDLEIAVRSGGHSVSGFSTVNGGILIDLSQMKNIEINPQACIAHIQPGATNGDVVLATQAYGLATTTGTCASVGMGGSTLGGGIGWLMGRFGATVDNVLAFEVVTADGEILTANAQQHPDLFWALRGGGGNFGIVTNITYKLHALGKVFGGMLVFHQAAATLVLRMYRELTANAPDELLAHAVLTTVPDFGPAIIIQAVYSGENLEEGERLLAALRGFGPPAIDTVGVHSYADLYMMFSPPEMPGAQWHETAYSLVQPGDEALDTIVAIAQSSPTPFTLINLHRVHGAATRVAPDATAFALREPHYAVLNGAGWFEGNGLVEKGWVEAARQRMRPYAHAGLYSNFLTDEGEQGIRESYRSNYQRLAWIKAKYDSENIFHRNVNIKPA